jgi:hypothetical protein
MQVRHIKIVVSLLAIVVAGAILFFRYWEPVPAIEPRPHLAIGEALAGKTAKALGAGGRITLISPDITAFKYPGAELQLKALHHALQQAKLTVSATNRIKLNPLYLSRVPPGDFTEILRRQSDADVVVSLLGPPLLTAEQKARVGEKRPRVIAICSGDMPRYFDLKPIFEDNFLHAAIISRQGAGTPSPSDSLSQWFNHFFMWVTAENLADLPETVAK